MYRIDVKDQRAGGSDCAASMPGRDPWLSILIPVYNVAPYLQACLDSILPQLPAEGVEVLLLDDVSTDHSLEICQAVCAAGGGPVRLLRHDRNSGLSAARNSMLDEARGDYIWFVDSDDEIMPGAIARMRAILDQCSPDILLCDYHKLGKDIASFVGTPNVCSTDREALVRGVFASRRMHSWSKIARRDIWGADLRFPVGRCFEDMATTPLLMLRSDSFYYAPESWIRYRVREDSITGIMSRTRGHFDDRKNDDVAVALTGFADAAHRTLPTMDADTRYAMGQFWAKEFTKLVWRLLSARVGRDKWPCIAGKLGRYRAMMEERAPVPFGELAAIHLRRGKPGRWLVLGLCLLVTSGPYRRWKAAA